MVDETLLSEEPLLVQVWSKRASPLPDYLIGESRARLDALIGAGGKATPTTFELGRPGHRQQGVLSCSLSFEEQGEATDLRSGSRQLSSPLQGISRDTTGALGLAVTVNREAEAAAEAFECAHVAHLQRQEILRIEREAAAVAAANNRLDAQSRVLTETEREEGNPANVNEGDKVIKTERRNLLKFVVDGAQSPGAYSGVDSTTGLPWRIDEAGCRRFFLGFPPVAEYGQQRPQLRS